MTFLENWKKRLPALNETPFYLGLLSIMAVTVGWVVTDFALDLHRNFLTIACDTATYQNTLVNLLQGRGFRDTAYNGPNLLGLHSAFVLVLIAPLYALFPSADLLFGLQIGVIYSAVIPLYLLADIILRRPLTAFLIAALALASPLLLHMAVAPFHTESGILAAVFWSCYFYRKNQALGFWLSFGFAVSCGEQAALIYGSLGFALLVLNDGLAWRKKYAVFAMAGALGWLIFTVGFLVPLMHNPDQQNIMAYHYSQWGIQSASGLALAIFKSPQQALMFLFNAKRWAHLASLIGVPLAMAFLSRRSLILLAPFPFYFLMCDQEFFLYFHAYYYQFAFVAGWLGLIYFLHRRDAGSKEEISVLAVTLLVNVIILCTVAGFYMGFDTGRNEAFSDALRAAFDRIPPAAAVYGPHRYSAYLSNRANMVMGDLRDENFDFKAMLDARLSTTDVHPEQIDYIVCDAINDQCGSRLGGYNPEATKLRAANVNKLIQSGQWQILWNQNDVVILQRSSR